MESIERLKLGRNLLLNLHKLLVDHERSIYEGIYGPVSAGQYLNLLLENEEFSWLRRFSTLIVEIDEMFAQKDGFTEEQIAASLEKIQHLVDLNFGEQEFLAKYRAALQMNLAAAAQHGLLKELFS